MNLPIILAASYTVAGVLVGLIIYATRGDR